MRLRSLYEESGSRQLTGSGNVPHVIFTRQFLRLTTTFLTGSCDVLSTSKHSLKGCSTFWPHIQVYHWNSYWVRSLTYDRVLSADRYGIRMANKKMIDMRAFLMRCLSPQGCTTNGLKLDKLKAWLRRLNAAACPGLCHLSKNQAICRLSSESTISLFLNLWPQQQSKHLQPSLSHMTRLHNLPRLTSQ